MTKSLQYHRNAKKYLKYIYINTVHDMKNKINIEIQKRFKKRKW